MNYYQVEFKNPDDFLKTQTEDFIKANCLLLFKEDDAYYLISQENYNDQEIMGKIKNFFDHEFTLNKVKILTESDFIKNLLIKRQAWLVVFLFYRGLVTKVEVEIRIGTIISYPKNID